VPLTSAPRGADEAIVEPTPHDFRPRAARLLATLGSVALLPFAVADLALGRPVVAIPMLALSAALMVGVWQLARGIYRPALVAAVFGVPAVVVNLIGSAKIGTMGTYWSYVIVLAYYLVFPRRWAMVFSATLIAAMAPFAWNEFGGEIGSRYAVTLVLVALFAHLTVGLVDDRERRLIEQMTIDPLTGVLNRSTLTSRLDAAAAQAAPVSLLALDVDHFKSINDRFGHETGDAVLSGLASVMASNVREGTAIFRLGGEEFVLLLERTDATLAEAVGQRLITSIAAHRFVDGHTVTASIGAAEVAPGESVQSWLRRADRALYRAKDAGRNTLALG
jgi:diguanylate cyclase (GGDEF)-like protein